MEVGGKEGVDARGIAVRGLVLGGESICSAFRRRLCALPVSPLVVGLSKFCTPIGREDRWSGGVDDGGGVGRRFVQQPVEDVDGWLSSCCWYLYKVVAAWTEYCTTSKKCQDDSVRFRKSTKVFPEKVRWGGEMVGPPRWRLEGRMMSRYINK